MTATPQTPNPATMLVGRRLDQGWTVVSRIVRPALATGGNFSISYIVESDRGQRGFLKALDYSEALQHPDVTQVLQDLTWAFNHERELLYGCARMSRVVTALGHGTIRDSHWPVPVSYLIFERADQDSRAFLDTADRFDMAWRLRALHHAAVGLEQLHSGSVAHQDLKPSNLLFFNAAGSKVADLGRSSHRTISGPFDERAIPGDRIYAPPELLYGAGSNDWEGRLALDMYQLGSLVAFFFTGLGMTHKLLTFLDRRVTPQQWHGHYSEVLPIVQQAFANAVDALATQIPHSVRAELSKVVRELCDPNPDRRGHPKNRLGYQNRYGLERYISRFNFLARQAEYGLRQRFQ